MDLGGSPLYQVKVAPLRDIWKRRHMIGSSLVYRFAWVRNTSRCSSGLAVQSYRSRLSGFQPRAPPHDVTPSPQCETRLQDKFYRGPTVGTNCTYQNLELSHVRMDMAEIGSMISHVGLRVLFTSFPKEGSEVIPGVESFCQEAFNAKKKVISSVAMKYVYADKEGQDDQTPCDQTTCFKYGLDPQRWVEFAASCKTPTWQLGAGTSLPGLAAEKLGAYVTFSYDSTKLKDLSHNKGLTGSLPHSIGNLTKLSNLFLVDCGFIGPIPYEIGPLKELVFF
ncbi:hypothetical protein JHK86_042854 [Glycine max]|nr:hypothetical protein JHK86_042854 [Glycine max]